MLRSVQTLYERGNYSIICICYCKYVLCRHHLHRHIMILR